MTSHNKANYLPAVAASGPEDEWDEAGDALDHPPPVTAREALGAPIGVDFGSSIATESDNGIVLLYVCPFLNKAGEDRLAQRDDGCRGVMGATDVDWDDDEPEPRLTRTEMRVLKKLAQGKTNRAIAAEMFVSINTVKSHVRAIFQKFGVNTRGTAVTHAVAKGLINWPPHLGPRNHPFGQYPKCD